MREAAPAIAAGHGEPGRRAAAGRIEFQTSRGSPGVDRRRRKRRGRLRVGVGRALALARPGARVNLEEGYQLRLSGIDAAVRSFPGIMGISIMNGGREVHVEVNNKRVQDQDLMYLSQSIAKNFWLR